MLFLSSRTNLILFSTVSATLASNVTASPSPIALTNFTSSSRNSTLPPTEGVPNPGGKCELLGPFALLVQAALGGLALLSLVYKRWRERPQRPVKVWAFDASKQVVGTVLLHMANLLMSMFSAGEIEAQIATAAAKTVGAGPDPDWRPNPCSFYLLNLGIDTTLGIPVLLLILKLLTIGAGYTALANPPESIKSGYYGDPPRASWWAKQCLIYFLGLVGMKACVFFFFVLCPWIVIVGDWALRWTEGNTALQIAFVMLIFPLIMNAFQYYVIDTFIKKKPDADDAASQISQASTEGERGGLLAGDEHGHADSINDDTVYKTVVRTSSTEFPDRANVGHQGPFSKGHRASAGSSDSSLTAAEGEESGTRVAKRVE